MFISNHQEQSNVKSQKLWLKEFVFHGDFGINILNFDLKNKITELCFVKIYSMACVRYLRNYTPMFKHEKNIILINHG